MPDSLALSQARGRWGDGVVVAGLFRPGPDERARGAVAKAMSRRSMRRQGQLPARLLVAVDGEGTASVCAIAADAQGGHPEGDDLHHGPFEELGAEPAGELAMRVALGGSSVVLEAAWLDRDAHTVVAFLCGLDLPEPEEPEEGPLEEPPAPFTGMPEL